MTPYMLCKKFIAAKLLPKTEILKRIDTFFMFGRISDEEYAELMELMEEKYA